MNKKIERLITAGIIAALVAIFFYQVAYGLDIKSLETRLCSLLKTVTIAAFLCLMAG